MFKKKFGIIFLLINNLIFTSDSVQIGISAKQTEKMSILIGIVKPDHFLNDISKKIKSDIEFSGQFKVSIEEFPSLKTKNDILNLADKGYQFAIFLNCNNGTEWRLYDATQAQMIKGKKVYVSKTNYSSIAHQFADEILPLLTGQQSGFASVVVACKQINMKKRRRYCNHLYVFHPVEYFNNLSEPKLILKETSVCLAPRWNCTKPLLYYSKHSSYNVRLMCLDMAKRKSLVSNFDGLNLTPAFSMDGKIVISLTKNGKGRMCKYEFDKNKKIGRFIPITDPKIHAICPSFIDNNRIVFCAIDKRNKARIAILDLTNNDIKYLTETNEHCVCPCCHAKNSIIAYCKKIKGYLQIFLYDLNTNEHKQLTFNSGDKDEVSWSPCGNYLTYSIDTNGKSRIAIFNLINNEQKILTPANENWTYPTWSPVYYDRMPFV